MLKPSIWRACLLWTPLLAGSCVSPSPGHVSSPDAELAALLGELGEVRGGELAGRVKDFSDADGARVRAAAAEGEIAAEVRRLSLVHSRHVPSLVANAALAYERNDSIGAQTYLDQALSYEPNHTQAILLRVRIAAESGNLPYAQRKLREQVALRPDVPDLHEALGGVLYLMDEHAEALEAIGTAENLRGEAMGTWRTNYHRGLIAEAQGDLGQARMYFQRSQEQEPGFERAAQRGRWLESRPR